MQKFYDFLKKFSENNKGNLIDTPSRKRYERIFINYFQEFIENNRCYLNFKNFDEDAAFEDAISDFEKMWFTEKADRKGEMHVKEWTFDKEYINLVSEFKITCVKNYNLKKVIEEKFRGSYTPVSEEEINKILFNLLYCAESFKIGSSTYNLLKWIKQTKINLKLDESLDSNHFLLQYSSRDKNDDTSKGGTGKSYILDGIRQALEKYIDEYVLFGQGLFPTNQFIGKEYSEKLFVIDDEMTSMKDLNLPALKNLLTASVYRCEEKGKMSMQRKNIANYIGASNQNYRKSWDGALCDRILEVQCDTTLNLRDEDILDEVKAYLPTKKEIGQSFINLLNIDNDTLDELLKKYKEKYDEERKNYADNEGCTYLVRQILYWMKGQELNKQIFKMRPEEIRTGLNMIGKVFKPREIINALLYMKEKLNMKIEAPVKDVHSKSADKNLYKVWTFHIDKMIIDMKIDELPHYDEGTTCIENALAFFNIKEKTRNLGEI